MYEKFGKRAFDLLIAAIGLVLFTPLCLTVTILLIAVDRGSPFFTQFRPGLHGKIFTLVKFRTMRDQVDCKDCDLPEQERITSLGHFLRRTSVDELPQLWNVLTGDMSLIGPRPLLVEYLLLYNADQQKRHQARPGISGWAQVHGRNELSWEDKFTFDCWYVENISFALDLKIIILTIRQALCSKHSSGRFPAKKFTGTR